MTDPGDDLRRARDRALADATGERTITVTGTISRLEVEARPWVLATVDGTAYELVGLPEALGARPPWPGRVVVTGRLVPGVLSINQVGPVLAVDAVAPESD